MTMSMATAGPGWRSFRIERQLDLVAAPMVGAALLSAAAGAESNLLIDLEAVDAADEFGVAALISAVMQVRFEHPKIQIAVLAHRPLLAESIARKLPAGVAELYRDRAEAHAGIGSLAAA